MKVLYLGTIPDKDDKNKGIFNYRAVTEMSQFVDIEVISIRIWKPGRKLFEKKVKKNIVFHHLSIPYIPILFNLKSLLFLRLKYYSLLIRIYLKYNDIKYDLIHSIGADVNGIIGSQLSERRKSKHLLQLIGSDINSIIPVLVKKKVLKRNYFSFDMLVANSMRLIPKWNEIFNENIENRCIYRGVDLNIFPCHSINRNEPVKFLFMGGLQKYESLPFNINTKGGITLMKAWSLIDKENLKAELFFGGPRTNVDVFHNWKRSLNNPKNVILVGKVVPSEMPNLLKKVSVTIIPSLEEGLPNFGVESIAVGRPIIGSNIGGIPEIIGDDETGWIIKPNNSFELYEKMKYLCQNKNEVYNKYQTSRNRAEKLFDNKLFSLKYFKIYNKMITD